MAAISVGLGGHYLVPPSDIFMARLWPPLLRAQSAFVDPRIPSSLVGQGLGVNVRVPPRCYLLAGPMSDDNPLAAGVCLVSKRMQGSRAVEVAGGGRPAVLTVVPPRSDPFGQLFWFSSRVFGVYGWLFTGE